MYAHKVIVVILSFWIKAVLLTACAGQAPADNDSILNDLLERGTLAAFEPEGLQAASPQLAQVQIGNLGTAWDLSVNIMFPNTYAVGFDESDMTDRVRNSAILRRNDEAITGDFIEAGTFVAELELDPNPQTLIRRMELELEREQFNSWFAEEQSRRRGEIEELRIEIDIADDWEIISLDLRRRELEYQLFTRESARRRTELARQLEDINELLYGERLYTPADGFIIHRTSAADGILFRDIPYHWADMVIGGVGVQQRFGRNMIIIVDDSDVRFIVEGYLGLLRYGDVFLMHDAIAGGVSFYVKVATDPLIHSASRSGTRTFVLVPADRAVFDAELNYHGLRPWDLTDIVLRARPVLPFATDSVIIPYRAIVYEGNRTFVHVYENGILHKRYVNMSAVQGGYTEILSGLEPGQWVVLQ